MTLGAGISEASPVRSGFIRRLAPEGNDERYRSDDLPRVDLPDLPHHAEEVKMQAWSLVGKDGGPAPALTERHPLGGDSGADLGAGITGFPTVPPRTPTRTESGTTKRRRKRCLHSNKSLPTLAGITNVSPEKLSKPSRDGLRSKPSSHNISGAP